MIEARLLTADDWQLWRRLRRAALAEAPEAFGSTLAQWSGTGDTEERWRARLAAAPLNLVLLDERRPAGMVSAVPNGLGAVELISLWVAPAARGRGVGDAAVRLVVAWAAEVHPGEDVVLSVRTSNGPATRLYARHGFVDAGPSPDDAAERLLRRRADPPSEPGA